MILWMGYAVWTGALVGGAAWAAERLAAGARWPTRLPWIMGLAAAALIPLFGTHAGAPAAQTLVEAVDPTDTLALITTADAWTAPWNRGAAILWLTLTAAGITLVAGALISVWRARRSWSRERVGSTDVLVSKTFGPGLVGYARPAIVLPRWVLGLGAPATSIIVRHEDEHRRALDNVALLFGGILAAAFPWNPAVWWMLSRLRAAVEVDCDARVLSAGISVSDYGQTLFEVGQHPSRSWGIAPSMAEPRSVLERRLRIMRKGRRGIGRVAATALFGGLATLLIVACETSPPTTIQEALDIGINTRQQDASDVDGMRGSGGISFSGDTLIVGGRLVLVGGDEPLVFVDGELLVPEGAEDNKSLLGDLDPDDIARVEVLKDRAAGEVFGPRGERYGVIQIYTKRHEETRDRAANDPG